MEYKLNLNMLAGLAFLTLSTNSVAFCIEPSAPFSKPNKPSTPYCVNEWANTHTCDQWEIDSYNSEVEAYNRDVEMYINDLELYVAEASDYARCEIDSL
ncbi:hypothetical protein [Methylophaga thiooxydans]|uniref:hypothetical protein n=1 Tax=Methylophaga thiooxydans TaxID=392484 RepID=UPI0005C534AB|nr:hypothetical protein [Methylophaga thiooxydans]